MGISTAAAELISASPLFAHLPTTARAALVAEVDVVPVSAGEVLFRQGDPGDSLFVVLTGRLEVVVSDEVVRLQSRGDVIGEVALLLDRPRSATVRAVRDAQLAVVTRAAFQRMVAAHPEVLAGVVEVLVERLPSAGQAPARRRGVVAVVGSAGVPGAAVTELVRRLGDELAALTTSVSLAEPGTDEGWGAALDALEANHDLVLLAAPDPGTAWARFCLRQADRRLVVVPATRPRRTAKDVLPEDAELVVTGRTDASTGWWAQSSGKRHLLGPDPEWPGTGRLARRLAGRALGVVLSGGGARGLAHLGAVQALEEAGMVVDRWGGTSMGALVAALYATGNETAAVSALLRRELVDGRPFGDYRLPRHSLIRAGRAGRMLDRLLGDARIEELDVPYFCVSCDLYSAAEVVHRHGPLAEAVGASMSIPGVAPPLRSDGRLLVDGGVLNNLPIDAMADEDEGPILAVDVMRPFGPNASVRMPGMVDVISRAMVLGSWQKSARTRALADVVVTPDLGTTGMFDFGRMSDIVERGRRATVSALSDAPVDPGSR